MSNSSQNFHLSNLENILSVFQILNVFNSNKLRCNCRNGTFSGFSLNIYILISICFISTALPAVNARIWKLEILTPPSQVNKQSYQKHFEMNVALFCFYSFKFYRHFLNWLVSTRNWPELLPKDRKANNVRFYVLFCMKIMHTTT